MNHLGKSLQAGLAVSFATLKEPRLKKPLLQP